MANIRGKKLSRFGNGKRYAALPVALSDEEMRRLKAYAEFEHIARCTLVGRILRAWLAETDAIYRRKGITVIDKVD